MHILVAFILKFIQCSSCVTYGAFVHIKPNVIISSKESPFTKAKHGDYMHLQPLHHIIFGYLGSHYQRT
jgi:hypothetical protein